MTITSFNSHKTNERHKKKTSDEPLVGGVVSLVL